MFNKSSKAALLSEAGMLGRLLVAVAVVAGLHGSHETIWVTAIASLGLFLWLLRLFTLPNSVRIAKELAVFREFQYAAILLAWATGAFSIGMPLWFVLYCVFATFVAEIALLKSN